MIKNIIALCIASAIVPSVAVANTLEISMSSHTDSGVSQDNLTNVMQPEFVGKTAPNSRVTIGINGLKTKTYSNSKGLFFWQPLPLSDGEYQLSAESNGEIVSMTFLIDTSTFLDYNQSLKNGHLVLTGASEPYSMVEVTVNGTTFTVTTNAAGNWMIEAIGVQVNDGDMIEVVATDIAGNTNGHTFPAQGEYVPHYLDAYLSKHSDSGVIGDGVTNIHTGITFHGTTTPDSFVVLELDGHSFESMANSKGEWSITSNKSLLDGNYQWEVTSTSPRNDSNTNYEGLEIDTSTPTISADIPDFVRANEDVVIKGNVGEPASMTITINEYTYTTFTDQDGNWSASTHGIPEGTHHVTIEAKDFADNYSMMRTSIEVLK